MTDAPPFAQLVYDVSDGICTVTLNRPEKKNALSGQLVNELIVAIETAAADPAVRVLLLTGAGGVFCAGGDLSQMSGAPGGESGVPWRGGFLELNLAFTNVGKPVVAKVRKYALAGGLALVCGAHFALAEDTATFGTPEIDRGLFPMMVMAAIARNVPRRRLLELVLTGDRIDAATAASIGLITRAVPPESLDAEVDTLARKLAAKSPAAMRLGLEAFHQQEEMATEEALPYLQEMLLKCLSTEDAREGLMAFMQKRPPVWTGR